MLPLQLSQSLSIPLPKALSFCSCISAFGSPAGRQHWAPGLLQSLLLLFLLHHLPFLSGGASPGWGAATRVVCIDPSAATLASPSWGIWAHFEPGSIQESLSPSSMLQKLSSCWLSPGPSPKPLNVFSAGPTTPSAILQLDQAFIPSLWSCFQPPQPR